MKTYVISLNSSFERREKVNIILHEHNISFEFINAIDGRTDQHPYLQKYNEEAFIHHYGRKAAPGEIGCYASHILAWEKCIKLNEPILIFEDDFILKPGVKDAISACEVLIADYGFIRMETTRKKPQYAVEKSGDFTLFNFIKVPQCTTCYAISPLVAQAFLKHSQSIHLPVDVFIKNIWIHKQPIYGLQPYFISACNDDSIIGKREKLEKSISTKAVCFLYKVRRIFCNSYYQLKWFIIRNSFKIRVSS